jgi:hypothetical protein
MYYKGKRYIAMFKTEQLLKDVDWSNAPPNVLEKAVEEYNLRLEEAKQLREKHRLDDDLERLYYGIPVSFPRSKHAAKLALTL